MAYYDGIYAARYPHPALANAAAAGMGGLVQDILDEGYRSSRQITEPYRTLASNLGFEWPEPWFGEGKLGLSVEYTKNITRSVLLLSYRMGGSHAAGWEAFSRATGADALAGDMSSFELDLHFHGETPAGLVAHLIAHGGFPDDSHIRSPAQVERNGEEITWGIVVHLCVHASRWTLETETELRIAYTDMQTAGGAIVELINTPGFFNHHLRSGKSLQPSDVYPPFRDSAFDLWFSQREKAHKEARLEAQTPILYTASFEKVSHAKSAVSALRKSLKQLGEKPELHHGSTQAYFLCEGPRDVGLIDETWSKRTTDIQVFVQSEASAHFVVQSTRWPSSGSLALRAPRPLQDLLSVFGASREAARDQLTLDHLRGVLWQVEAEDLGWVRTLGATLLEVENDGESRTYACSHLSTLVRCYLTQLYKDPVVLRANTP